MWIRCAGRNNITKTKNSKSTKSHLKDVKNMKTSIARLLAGTASVLLFLTLPLDAAEKTQVESKPGTSSEKRVVTRSTYPFRGEVESVAGSVIQLAKKDGIRKVEFAPETLFQRDGKSITVSDLKPGDYVRGLARKSEDGTEVIVKATAGPRPEKGTVKKSKKSV